MDQLRISWALLTVLLALSGCVREEEALSGNGSDPIGTGNPTPDPTTPTPTPTPPPAGSLQMTAPAAMQSEATGPLTMLSLTQPTATGGDGSYSFTNDAPAGGFGLGLTAVTWTVTDGSGATVSGIQNVTVEDTTAPEIAKPADLQDVSTGTLTMVNIGMATATDLVDASPAVSNDMPAAGFPMGVTPVNWTATDASGNASSAVQMITITAPTSGPLMITAPTAISQEASGPLSTVMLGSALAAGGTPPYAITNDAPAGGFPVGTTTVTWTVTDGSMGTQTATQAIRIVDSTPPSIMAPNAIVADQASDLGRTTISLGTPTTSDIADPNPDVSNDAPGNGFPVGDTVVVWTATDASGNTAMANQLVTVNAFVATQCDALVDEFANSVYPMMAEVTTCGSCHTGPNPRPTLNNFGFPNDPPTADDFEVFRTVANINFGNESTITAKARGLDSHAGGVVFANTADPNYVLLAEFVTEARNCVETAPGTASVMLGSGYEQLHKIVAIAGSRTPTTDEVNLVLAAGSDQQAVDAALTAILDGLMNEDPFYVRIKEMYNDLLLTNRNENSRSNPRDRFDLDGFVDNNYFDSWSNDARESTNYGIARAPVELVEYVIRNDRPFTEIATADYMMVNPFSATVFGVNPGGGGYPYPVGGDPDAYDKDDFRPVNSITQRRGDQATLPLAGTIATHSFLVRYPTTNTNVNRKRARFIFDYFLGINIEDLASREGLDLDNVIGTVPTYEDPQCTICHDIMDPVAGLFTRRDNEGEYDTDNTYQHTRTSGGVPRMVPAGYGNTRTNPANELPASEFDRPLQWLGARIAADDRFATHTVKTVFEGFTGIEGTTAATTAFINDTKDRFVASNFDFKALVTDILLSDYFRAANLALTENPNDSEYLDIGAGRLLTSEELDRRISAAAGGGYSWRGPNSRSGLDGRHYLLYGGIDSDEVIVRTDEPTALIDGIQERIANQFACERVATDLYTGGTLFPVADENDVPDGGAGEDAIRANIQFLHRHLLGEDLALNSPELDSTFQLFLDARDLDETSIPSQCRGGGGPTDTNRTVLPWMAVVTYLVGDYRFLYE